MSQSAEMDKLAMEAAQKFFIGKTYREIMDMEPHAIYVAGFQAALNSMRLSEIESKNLKRIYSLYYDGEFTLEGEISILFGIIDRLTARKDGESK